MVIILKEEPTTIIATVETRIAIAASAHMGSATGIGPHLVLNFGPKKNCLECRNDLVFTLLSRACSHSERTAEMTQTGLPPSSTKAKNTMRFMKNVGALEPSRSHTIGQIPSRAIGVIFVNKNLTKLNNKRYVVIKKRTGLCDKVRES